MHPESYLEMERMVETYLDPAIPLSILDVGSCDINGCYRALFDRPGWRYEGLDLEPGPNVDRVLENPYKWTLGDATYDVVISGQALEHMKFFWLTWHEMVRVLKPGGFILLIAPSQGMEHRIPVDCWRFYRDGFHALAELENLSLLEAETHWDWYWGDTVGAFRKEGAVRSSPGTLHGSD
jgi:SAM-dependent methyltransferase